MRQALFDMLMHAPWAAGCVAGAKVADVFAGTGALGLEALSRGAAACVFVEQDRAALAALRANIAACRAGAAAQVLAQDALRVAPAPPCDLVFLDPPYGQDLATRAVAALTDAGWITPATLIVAETGRDEALPCAAPLLAERSHGAGRVTIWRQQG
jgi:16S rRNA (guanine966-N2)-methyltransferase